MEEALRAKLPEEIEIALGQRRPAGLLLHYLGGIMKIKSPGELSLGAFASGWQNL